MTGAELDAIESCLSVRLPAYYREFMLNYPPALVEAKKDFGWFRESPAERQLQRSARSLLEMNEDLRRPGTPWTADDGPWPPCYFAIGNDQCGNYWCIDLTTTDPGIWFYDHDPGRFDLRYATIQAFADELLSDVGSWNRERGSSGSTVGEVN